jgi:hypothetical protein
LQRVRIRKTLSLLSRRVATPNLNELPGSSFAGRHIAEANAAVELARQRAVGNEEPGSKIEQALRLSNELLRHVARESESERKRFSLIEQWRAARAEGRSGRAGG